MYLYIISAVNVSGTVVGKYKQTSFYAEDYIDGSRGNEVLLDFPSQLARLDERTILIADMKADMVRK